VEDFRISSPFVLSVVFDLTSQREAGGKKYFDIIVQKLREFTTNGSQNIVYVAHPDNKMPRNASESHAQLIQYVEPVSRSMRDEIRRAVTTIGEYSDDVRKRVIFFTDRYKSTMSSQFLSGFLENKGRHYDCDIILCAVGNYADYKNLESLASKNDAKAIKVVTEEQIINFLKRLED